MADIQAAFKLTAGVTGQQAVQKLHDTVGGINTQVGKLPGLAKTAGLALVGLGAGLSIGVVKEKFDGMVESMLALKDASERVGTTVENMSALGAVAKITGDDLGMVEAGMIRLNKSLAGSDDEAKGAAHALDAIGLNIKELRQLDPAEAFKRVALALAQFENNGAKSAIAMDLFGKSGAQLLPFLNDYADLADTVGKVTGEQAEKADQYDRNLRKLTAAQQDLYKVLTLEMLPVANDFIGALLDIGTHTNGVKDKARSLAADGSLKSFFQDGAMFAAILLESLVAVGKAIKAIGGSFSVVAADLKSSWAFVRSSPTEIGDALFKGTGPLAQVWNEREKTIKGADQAWLDLWNYDSTAFSRSLKERFNAASVGAGGGRGSAEFAADDPRRTDKKKDGTGYQSRPPTLPKTGGGGSEADPFTTELNSLNRESAKLQWQTDHIQQYAEKITSAKEAQVAFDVEQGKFKDLSQAQKDTLLAAARAVDENAEAMRKAQVAMEFNKQTDAIDTNTQSLGLNSRERELAAASQELENKGIKKGTEEYEKLMAARDAALERKASAESNPFLGLKMGMAQLGDEVNNRAKAMQDVLVNAFNGAADALTTFLTTGKADFKSFATSIISDLIRMIVKQQLFNALSAGMSALGLGSAAAASGTASAGTASVAAMAANGASFDGNVAKFAAGGAFTNTVVTQSTLFKFAAGGLKTGLMGEAGPEAIMPLSGGGVAMLDASGRQVGHMPIARGPGGRLSVVAPAAFADGGSFGQVVTPSGASGSSGGASLTISVPVSIQGSGQQAQQQSASSADAAQLSKMVEDKVKDVVTKESRPGGLVYRIMRAA